MRDLNEVVIYMYRGGKWYLENCRSRKIFIQSQNLGAAFVMSLVFVNFLESQIF